MSPILRVCSQSHGCLGPTDRPCSALRPASLARTVAHRTSILWPPHVICQVYTTPHLVRNKMALTALFQVRYFRLISTLLSTHSCTLDKNCHTTTVRGMWLISSLKDKLSVPACDKALRNKQRGVFNLMIQDLHHASSMWMTVKIYTQFCLLLEYHNIYL